MFCNFVTLLTAYNSFCSVLMRERSFALTRVLERVPLSAHLIKVSNSGKVSLVNSIWGFHKHCTGVTVTLVVFFFFFIEILVPRYGFKPLKVCT